MLLEVVPFLRLTGQRLLGRELATQAAAVLRAPDMEKQLAPTLVTLGNAQFELGERSAAGASLEEALEIYRGLAEQHPAAFEPDVATTLNNLGSVQIALERWALLDELFPSSGSLVRDLSPAGRAGSGGLRVGRGDDAE